MSSTNSPRARRFRFTPEGPEILEEEWRTCLEQLTMLDFDYLVASGSLPRGVPEDFYRNVAKVASTKGAKFVLDTSGPALKAALGYGIHLAKPSRGELESLTGQDLKDPDALVSAAQDLVVSGTIEHLVVTMGHEGALLVSAAEVKRLRAPEVEVKSAVGAGDSFVGAMTLGLALGRPLDEAFALGVAAGTATVTTIGTELCQREVVEALYETLMQISWRRKDLHLCSGGGERPDETRATDDLTQPPASSPPPSKYRRCAPKPPIPAHPYADGWSRARRPRQ